MVLKVSRRRESSETGFKEIRRKRNGLEVTVLSAGQLQGLPGAVITCGHTNRACGH